MDTKGPKASANPSLLDLIQSRPAPPRTGESTVGQSLSTAIDVGTITFNCDLRVQSFTPPAAALIPGLRVNAHQHLEDLADSIHCSELVHDAHQALQGHLASEREVEIGQGRWCLLQAQPLQSETDIDGVAVSLVSIDTLTAMQHELRLMSKVVMDSADPILIEDLQGTIIYANSEAVDSYGWSREELLGSRVELLIPDADLAFSRQRRDDCRRGRPVRHLETTRRRKSGEICPTLLTYSLIKDDAGRPVAVASIAKDITAQKAAESLARQAVERRDQFLAMLSHELRNPLGAVLNATYVLDDNCSVRHKCKSPCQVIQRQTHQMSRLLDDLLDVTRVTQGKIEIRPQAVNIREMVENVLPTVARDVQQRDQQLLVDIDARPMTIHGDATRLQQIQVNLLTNAIKYTPAGGKIWLRVYPDQGDIVLRVRDTGEGIPADMLESVFDLFVQGRATLDRSDGGMGVGLTLAKQLVELHGGNIAAYSDGPGKGTEFIVRLPAYSDSGAELAQSGGCDAPAQEHCGQILIVEDNADSRDMLRSLLEIYGYRVQAASNGRAGLELLQQHEFDLALVDIGLPGIDGYEVARTIRSDPKHDGIRLVALTGYGADGDRAAVKEAGFDEHLIKPLQREDLDKVLPRTPDA